MYIDNNLMFADGQAVTTTAIGSNVTDLFSVDSAGGTSMPNTAIDIGTGTGHAYLVVTTKGQYSGPGGATVNVSLESADDAGLSVNPQVHFSTGALAFAAFGPAGAKIARVRLPSGNYKRYLGVRFTVASGPLTGGGSFNAFISTGVDANTPYKSGFIVQ